MPTIEENLAAWDQRYDWAKRGDEWSKPWGSAEAQWHGCLLPRLRHFLPAARIVEIAPGYGRWTQYLAELCDELTIVDLSETCIDVCRRRLAAHDHITYVVNDGLSLPTVPDGSVDLVFSFDSLVHVESDVISAYLHEVRRVLAADGTAFLHHSNIGEYREQYEREAALPEEERQRLLAARQLAPTHWRAFSMTAARFNELAEQAGLRCIAQELIQWSLGRQIDAISVVTLPNSRYDRPRRVIRNADFQVEARSIRSAWNAYSERGELA